MALQGWNNATSVGAYGPWGTGLSGTLGTGLPAGGSTSGAGGAGSSTSGSGGVLPSPPLALASAPAIGSGGGNNSIAPPGSFSAGNGAQAAALTMADGGVIPSQGGTATPDLESALASVQSSLAAGRQQFGLPAQLMGGSQPSSTGNDNGDDSDTDSDEQSNYQNGKGMLEMKMVPGTTQRTQGKNVQSQGYTPGYGNSFEAGGEPQAGAIPGAANPDEGLLQASQAQREAIQRAQLSAKEGQGQSVLYPGGGYARGGKVKSFDDGGNMDDPSSAQLAAPSFDDGGEPGALPTGGDMDDPSSQGMPAQPQDNMPSPQQGQTQPANDPQKSLQMYAMGAGAVPPEMAAALEQKVDPTGAMDPSQRKLLAVASAPDPQSQFGMMQHYRQRFNALTAFARAAGTGTQARPADISASTQAATRAFHNVPNGHSISFSPAGANHVAVTMAQYAGGKGGAGKKGKGYAAGGPVPDDTPADSVPDASETGPQDVSGVMPDTSGAVAALVSGAQGAQDVEANSDQAMTQPIQSDDGSFAQGMQQAEGAIPSGNPVLGAARAAGKAYRSASEGGEKIKQSIMSVPQYLSTLKNSLYDAFMDTPPDSALADAANKSWASSISAPGMDNGNATSPDQTPAQNINPQPPTSGMTIGAGPGAGNPIVNAQNPVKAGSPSPSAPTTPGAVPPGMRDIGGGISLMDPTAQGVQGMRSMLAADNNGQGARPVQATIPGFDPRIMAQANAMYAPGSQAWKDFATKAQTGLMEATNARSMQELKNQGMKDLWGNKEDAINGRSDARNATSIRRAQIIAGQRAIASGARNVSDVMKAIIGGVPGTLPQDAFQQAQQLLSQGGSPAQSGAPAQGGQAPAAPATPAQQPITGPIAVNPKTGQRMTVRNGAWVPLP